MKNNGQKNYHKAQDRVEEESDRRDKYMVFSLRGKLHCMLLSNIKEVVTTFKITPLPKMESHYHGVINLRGQIVTVLDLGKKLNYVPIQIVEKKSCIIIIQVEDLVLGALVDEVLSVELFKRSESQFSTLSGDHPSGREKGVSRVIRPEKGGLILQVDVERAFDIHQIRNLKLKQSA